MLVQPSVRCLTAQGRPLILTRGFTKKSCMSLRTVVADVCVKAVMMFIQWENCFRFHTSPLVYFRFCIVLWTLLVELTL